MKKVIVVTAATMVVLSGASVALAASVASTGSSSVTTGGHSEEYDAWVVNGTAGYTDEGREDNEDQQWPGYTNFTLVNTHDPGVSNATFRIFAQGFTEDIRQFYNVVYQPDFTWDTCTSDDAAAFGVDRGNDEPGTTTDESFLQAYERVTYHSDGIIVKFYKEKTLAGNPKVLNVEDEVVSQVNECLTTPSEPGWYRMTGYINGSTKNDTQQDYTIYGGAQHMYICQGCDSREEARQRLGPEPTTCPQKWGKEFVCRSWDGEYYTANDPPDGQDSEQSRSTPTPEATATPTPAQASDTDGGGGGDSSGGGDAPTPTPTATSDGGGGGQQDDGRQQSGGGGDGAQEQDDTQPARVQTDSVPVTPTIAEGPGFGAALAIGALLGAALVTLRREQ